MKAFKCSGCKIIYRIALSFADWNWTIKLVQQKFPLRKVVRWIGINLLCCTAMKKRNSYARIRGKKSVPEGNEKVTVLENRCLTFLGKGLFWGVAIKHQKLFLRIHAHVKKEFLGCVAAAAVKCENSWIEGAKFPYCTCTTPPIDRQESLTRGKAEKRASC